MATFFMKKQVQGRFHKLIAIESDELTNASSIRDFMVSQGFLVATQKEWESAGIIYEERYGKI